MQDLGWDTLTQAIAEYSKDFDKEVFSFSEQKNRRFRPQPTMGPRVSEEKCTQDKTQERERDQNNPKKEGMEGKRDEIYTDETLFMEYVEKKYPVVETMDANFNLHIEEGKNRTMQEEIPLTVKSAEGLVQIEKRIASILKKRRDKKGFKLTTPQAMKELHKIIEHLTPHGEDTVMHILDAPETWRTSKKLRLLVKK